MRKIRKKIKDNFDEYKVFRLEPFIIARIVSFLIPLLKLSSVIDLYFRDLRDSKSSHPFLRFWIALPSPLLFIYDITSVYFRTYSTQVEINVHIVSIGIIFNDFAIIRPYIMLFKYVMTYTNQILIETDLLRLNIE